MFKSTSGIEFTATNGNTVKVDIDGDGNVRICARKGSHNQSVSVISGSDASALAGFIASDPLRGLPTFLPF
jgi:hypothetical protein